MDKKILQEKISKLHELQNTIKKSKKRDFDGFLREFQKNKILSNNDKLTDEIKESITKFISQVKSKNQKEKEFPESLKKLHQEMSILKKEILAEFEDCFILTFSTKEKSASVSFLSDLKNLPEIEIILGQETNNTNNFSFIIKGDISFIKGYIEQYLIRFNIKEKISIEDIDLFINKKEIEELIKPSSSTINDFKMLLRYISISQAQLDKLNNIHYSVISSLSFEQQKVFNRHGGFVSCFLNSSPLEHIEDFYDNAIRGLHKETYSLFLEAEKNASLKEEFDKFINETTNVLKSECQSNLAKAEILLNEKRPYIKKLEEISQLKRKIKIDGFDILTIKHNEYHDQFIKIAMENGIFVKEDFDLFSNKSKYAIMLFPKDYSPKNLVDNLYVHNEIIGQIKELKFRRYNPN